MELAINVREQLYSFTITIIITAKKSGQMNILRIRLCNEMAISSDNILDSGCLAGLCLGIPVNGPHHSQHLLDQVLDFFVRLCIHL